MTPARGAAWVAAAALLASCNPQPATWPGARSTAGATAAPTAVPPLIVTGQGTAQRPVRIVQQRGNHRQYELLARSYHSSGAQGATRAVFEDARVTFYGKDGSTLRAQAPQALLDEAANTVTLQPRVQARSSNGITLFCDRLVYDRTTQMFHGSGNVSIVNGQGLHATGSTIDTDVTLTKTRMQ